MDFLISKFHLILMVLVRISIIIFIFPLFGYSVVPIKIRIGLSILLTFIVVPLILDQHINGPENLLVFFFMVGREALCGLIIGFSATLLFMAFQFAGTIVGLQMGFGIVNVIDPQSNAQVSIIGQLLYIVAILMFLAINGHHYLIEALVHSFEVIPLTKPIFTDKIVHKIVMMSADVFVIAIKIGIPTIIALLLTNVALGIMARTVPQMNVFIVGFPIGISLGLFTLASTFPLYIFLFSKLMRMFKTDMTTIINLLAP